MIIRLIMAASILISLPGCRERQLDARNPADCLAAFVTVGNLAKGHPVEHDGRMALLSEAAAFEIYKAKSTGQSDALQRESEKAAEQMAKNPDLSYALATKCGAIVFADPAEKAFRRTFSGS